MNCLYCGQPVPKSPTDGQGIPLMPESVHITCVAKRLEQLDDFLRVAVDATPSGTTLEFPKYAPLKTVSTTEKGE